MADPVARPLEIEPGAPLQVIDSHTAGEPTRTVIGGLPDLGGGEVAQQRAQLARRADWVRRALLDEPRGSDVMVGAALLPPSRADCEAGVVFFNNAGYLQMCGHGMIGVVATLRWLGRLKAGLHCFETPAGVVRVQLDAAGNVQLENVTSCRWRRDVVLDLPSGKTIRGDIAWGGNWFFLAAEHGQPIDWAEIPRLTAVTTSIRAALESRGICGRSGGVIDHIELVTPLPDAAADFANFVLCPGMAFDRSPCGTGSSAKVACLAAADQLAPGQRIRIRGITGECFEASYRWAGPEDEGAEEWSEAEGRPIIPTIIGRAYVNGRCELVFDPQDPFRFGLSVG